MRQWVQRAHSQYLHLWIEFGGRQMGDTPFLNLRPTLACLTLNWMHTDTAADTCGSIAYMSRQHVLTDVLALTDLRIFVSYSHSCILLSININHIFHKLAVVFFFVFCFFFSILNHRLHIDQPQQLFHHTVLQGNLGSWYSCGCQLRHTTNPKTTADQIHTLMVVAHHDGRMMHPTTPQKTA